MKFRKALSLVVLVAIAAVAVFLWRYLSVPVVALTTPERGQAVDTVYATGTVEPTYWAKITPLVRGRLVEICNCEGETVSADDVLARLDARELTAEVERLQARERFLRDEAERYRKLLARKVVSSQAYERIASQREEIVAAIAAARQRLAETELRTPIPGTVLRRDGEVGEIVAPGEIVFWVGRTRPLRVTAEVDEEYMPKIRLGQEVQIAADAFPGRSFTGRLSHITPKGDPVNKTYRVRVSLPDDAPLLIGMTTEINVVVDRQDAVLLVPVTAIDGGYAWTVEDGRTRKIPVEIGIVDEERAQIVSGLDPATRVIADPPRGLQPDTRVRVAGAP